MSKPNDNNMILWDIGFHEDDSHTITGWSLRMDFITHLGCFKNIMTSFAQFCVKNSRIKTFADQCKHRGTWISALATYLLTEYPRNLSSLLVCIDKELSVCLALQRNSFMKRTLCTWQNQTKSPSYILLPNSILRKTVI